MSTVEVRTSCSLTIIVKKYKAVPDMVLAYGQIIGGMQVTNNFWSQLQIQNWNFVYVY